ncbi:MAG: 16S rRNA (guanine(966)-N(2))-methyltransferase RsmD [Deltaproteobacteria bacterium]|nr:16S rRNA (guanine(966)-N(2))-methyltransferase RsmD [Deltaproteobacteria bacterium]
MTKVSSGEKRGFRLKSVKSKYLRPLTNKVKDAIFNIIGDLSSYPVVLDLFAGTGSFGFEALSRGAKICYFVELNKRIFRILEENCKILGYTNNVKLFNADAFRIIAKTTKQFDIIFVAPPQFKGMAFRAMSEIFARPEIVKPSGLVIAQVDRREDLRISPTYFRLFDDRIYGDTRILFYERI